MIKLVLSQHITHPHFKMNERKGRLSSLSTYC